MDEILSMVITHPYLSGTGGAIALTVAVLVYRRLPQRYKDLLKEAATVFGKFLKRSKK